MSLQSHSEEQPWLQEKSYTGDEFSRHFQYLNNILEYLEQDFQILCWCLILYTGISSTNVSKEVFHSHKTSEVDSSKF